jgi:hypothetical protein
MLKRAIGKKPDEVAQDADDEANELWAAMARIQKSTTNLATLAKNRRREIAKGFLLTPYFTRD